jgi:hypothetical protein
MAVYLLQQGTFHRVNTKILGSIALSRGSGYLQDGDEHILATGTDYYGVKLRGDSKLRQGICVKCEGGKSD